LAIGFDVAASLGGSWGTSQLPLMGQWNPVTIKFGLTSADGSLTQRSTRLFFVLTTIGYGMIGDYGSVTGGTFAIYSDLLDDMLSDNTTAQSDIDDMKRLRTGTTLVTVSLVFSILFCSCLTIWSLLVWPIGPFQCLKKYYR
jgi:hypothetical protein